MAAEAFHGGRKPPHGSEGREIAGAAASPAPSRWHAVLKPRNSRRLYSGDSRRTHSWQRRSNSGPSAWSAWASCLAAPSARIRQAVELVQAVRRQAGRVHRAEACGPGGRRLPLASSVARHGDPLAWGGPGGEENRAGERFGKDPQRHADTSRGRASFGAFVWMTRQRWRRGQGRACPSSWKGALMRALQPGQTARMSWSMIGSEFGDGLPRAHCPLGAKSRRGAANRRAIAPPPDRTEDRCQPLTTSLSSAATIKKTYRGKNG